MELRGAWGASGGEGSVVEKRESSGMFLKETTGSSRCGGGISGRRRPMGKKSA